MDDRLKQEVLVFARRLTVQEKDRLAELGMFVENEDLTAEIGNELAKQLAQYLLWDWADEAAAVPSRVPGLPEGGPARSGARGEIEYSEPVCYCTRCRVCFFPGGRRIGASGS